MRKLEEDVFVSGQIHTEQVAELAAQGIRTVINNRPDGEAPGQPEGDLIRLAAEQAGLNYVSVPTSQITSEAVDGMRRALEGSERPILAFCAVGARSTFLWALARAGQLDADELERRAAAAGYDLTPIRRFL